MTMESANVIYRIGIITGVTFCVTIFLLYLGRIAVFLNRKRLKYILYAVWSAALILILLFLFLHRNGEFKIRVSYFPLFNDTDFSSIYYADAANMLTDKAAEKNILVYPVDWYFSSLHPDSTNNTAHIKKRARKFGLDYLIFVSNDSGRNAGLKFVIYNVKKETAEDSLFPICKNKSLLHAVRKISEILNIELNDSSSFLRSETSSFYSIARKAEFENDYKKAAENYKTCISLKENYDIRLSYAASLIKEGFKHMRTGDSGNYFFLLARDALNKVEESGKDDPHYNLLWAELYIYKEMWNKASFHLKQVFKYSRNIPEAYFFLSRLHKSRYKHIVHGSKIKLLKKSVYLNPAYKEAWLSLAQNLFAKGFYKEAEKTYRKIISLIPECSDAYIGLASISGSKNNIEELFEIYRELISVKPDDGLPYYNLGILYWKTKDFDKSEKFFQKATSLSGSINSYFYLGLIESGKGNKREALKYFKKRISLRTGANDHFADVAAEKIKALLSTGEKGE